MQKAKKQVADSAQNQKAAGRCRETPSCQACCAAQLGSSQRSPFPAQVLITARGDNQQGLQGSSSSNHHTDPSGAKYNGVNILQHPRTVPSKCLVAQTILRLTLAPKNKALPIPSYPKSRVQSKSSALFHSQAREEWLLRTR